MALSYNTLYAIPRLSSYEDALRRYEATTPIRGDEYKRRPLGQRNQKWRHIKKEADNSIAIYDGGGAEEGKPDGNIVYRAGEPPIIRYLPNGELHILDTGYWSKASYNEVITEVTGLYVFTEKYKAWVRYDGGTAPLRAAVKPRFVSGKGWVKPKHEIIPSIFIKNERGNWVYTNPPTLTTHVVNRTGAKQVRERYAVGLSYVEALAKLRRDESPKLEEYMEPFADKLTSLTDEQRKYMWHWRDTLPPATYLNSVGGYHFKRGHAVEIAALLASADTQDQYKAYLWLHREAAPDRVMKNARLVLMMVHNDEWFTEREVPAGKKAHDTYAWAFKG